MNIGSTQILVTGGSGSLGRQLLYSLTKQGIRPIAHMRAGSNSAYADSLGLEKRLADLRNEAELARLVAGVDCIIHTAAWVNFRQDRLTQFTGLNTFGAVKLYEAARKAGVKRFIQVSSVAAVGGMQRSGKGAPVPPLMTEEHPFNLGHLRIPYILTKRAAEDELLKLWRQGGPELVIVNPSIIVAPSRSGDDRSKATKLFSRAFLPKLPNIVPLVDMRDVAPAIVAAITQGRAGERYILTGENIPATELIRLASELLAAKPRLIGIPRWSLDLASQFSAGYGRFAGKAKISFYPDLVKMLDYDWGFSSDKARAELGFAPRPLRTTLTDLLSNNFTGTWQKP